MKISSFTISLIVSMLASLIVFITGTLNGFTKEIVWLTTILSLYLTIIILLLLDFVTILGEKQK